MKIVSIFVKQFYAFHFDSEKFDAYRMLMEEEWNNLDFLSDFYKQNKTDLEKNYNEYEFIDEILKTAAEFNDSLIEITQDPKRCLDEGFKPFHNEEYLERTLSLQKSKKHSLRIYAI